MTLTEADFLGEWTITREIEDRLSGQSGTLVGTATFEREDRVVRYRETGDFAYAGQAPLRAERSYIWTFSNGQVEVRHGDGSAFHSFPLSDSAEATPHLCGADMYRGHYSFSDFPLWEVRWDVEGPRKRYRSVTLYRRGADPRL